MTVESVGGDVVERDKGPMTIEYEMTAEDGVNLQRYWYRHKLRGRSRFGWTLALANGLALGLLLAGPTLTVRSIIYYVACCSVFLVAWATILYGVAPRIAKKQLQRGKNLGIVGKHTIRLETGGCRETTDVSESFHAWRGIDIIDADARYVYIFLHGASGYIIPRRAFPSIAASDDFFAAARRLHAANSDAGARTSAPNVKRA